MPPARRFGRRFAVPGLTGLFGLAMAVAAPPAQDPWQKVPAPPTGCFTSDNFYDRMQGAIDSLAADIQRQSDVNTVISDAYRNLGPEELQSRMMEFMTQNPQDAAEFMEKMQAIGQSNSGERLQRIEESRLTLVAERDALKARFDAALEESWAPARTMLAALGDGCGASPPGPKENAAIDRVNAEYRRLCGEYWGPAGHFQSWLGKYKEYLVKGRVPVYEAYDKQQLEVYAAMKIPIDTFKSTVPLTAVSDYMEQVQSIYQNRWQASWPSR